MADQGAEGLLSPWLRRKRIAAARPYLHGRVLDYGCGAGELACVCSPDQYYGMDIDSEVIALAKSRYPDYRFERDVPSDEQFDTIVALAVIEHIADPGALLIMFRRLMTPAASIVITTPHPSVDRVHTLGAKVGLFSVHANEEHEELINLRRMREITETAGLRIEKTRRFLLRANQLFVITNN